MGRHGGGGKWPIPSQASHSTAQKGIPLQPTASPGCPWTPELLPLYRPCAHRFSSWLSKLDRSDSRSISYSYRALSKLPVSPLPYLIAIFHQCMGHKKYALIKSFWFSSFVFLNLTVSALISLDSLKNHYQFEIGFLPFVFKAYPFLSILILFSHNSEKAYQVFLWKNSNNSSGMNYKWLAFIEHLLSARECANYLTNYVT